MTMDEMLLMPALLFLSNVQTAGEGSRPPLDVMARNADLAAVLRRLNDSLAGLPASAAVGSAPGKADNARGGCGLAT